MTITYSNMFQYISGAKAVGVIAAGAVGGGLLAQGAQATLGSTTPIELGVVIGFVVGVFYAGRMLQRILDGQKQTHRRLVRIERKLHIDDGPTDDDQDNEQGENA